MTIADFILLSNHLSVPDGATISNTKYIDDVCLLKVDTSNLRLFGPLVLLLPNTFKLFSCYYFEFERTWWRLFQKRVVRTKFDIYICIITFNYMVKCLIEMMDSGTHTLYCSTNIVRVCLPLTTKMHVFLFWRLRALPFHSLTLRQHKYLKFWLKQDCAVLIHIYNHVLIMEIESDQWVGSRIVHLEVWSI